MVSKSNVSADCPGIAAFTGNNGDANGRNGEGSYGYLCK
jgi:hypothetical protein